MNSEKPPPHHLFREPEQSNTADGSRPHAGTPVPRPHLCSPGCLPQGETEHPWDSTSERGCLRLAAP